MLFFLTAAPLCLRADEPGVQKEDAVQALERDVKSSPHNPELWLHLGFAYRKLDEVDKAENAFEKVIALDPQNRDALYMLGLIYEKKNQTEEALKVWKNYLAVEPDPAKRDVAEKHIHHLSQ